MIAMLLCGKKKYQIKILISLGLIPRSAASILFSPQIITD
jgi:hypothetical protein